MKCTAPWLFRERREADVIYIWRVWRYPGHHGTQFAHDTSVVVELYHSWLDLHCWISDFEKNEVIFKYIGGITNNV